MSAETREPKAVTELTLALKEVNQKLQAIIDLNTEILKVNQQLLKRQPNPTPVGKPSLTPDTMSLLTLPMTLRKTIMVLYKFEKATADDLAQETKRLRAVESAAANELVRMGYISKRREGRTVYFFVEGGRADA